MESKIFSMKLSKVLPLLFQKAEKKGRTREEVETVIHWLMGYSAEELVVLLDSDVCYGKFFTQAPAMNPLRSLVTGTICGIRVENIEDPLMRDIRILDKLIDELAKGKPLDKILRKAQ